MNLVPKKSRPRTIASIEARMGSSRLPGKVLMDIHGQPAIARLVFRLQRAKTLDGIILATSTAPADDALADWAKRAGLPCYRGSEDDVLGRVVGAQQQMGSELVVEVTGDCSMLDPEIIDWGVETYLTNDCEVVSNTSKLSFPMGMDVQVFPLSLLEEVAATIQDPAVREHVSLYFYEHPERYRILHLLAPPGWQAPEMRFMLDYPQDLDFLRAVYAELLPLNQDFGMHDIMSLLRRRPELLALNCDCQEKPAR